MKEGAPAGDSGRRRSETLFGYTSEYRRDREVPRPQVEFGKVPGSLLWWLGRFNEAGFFPQKKGRLKRHSLRE